MDQLGFIGFCTLALLGIRYGEGVHLWDINVPNAIQGAKVSCHRLPVRRRGCRAKELVGRCIGCLLFLLDLHREALDIAAVPEHFRAGSTRSTVLHYPLSDLDELDCLPGHGILCIVPMHSKRKDLGPASSRQMPQLYCSIGRQ